MAWLNLTMPNQTVKNGLKAKKIKLPQMNFFLEKQLIKFSCTYWPLSFCKILKKFLKPIQIYEDVPFSGPKYPNLSWTKYFGTNHYYYFHLPIETFHWAKPVNEPCFFHSCLSTCQKSKSDINLLVKYRWLKNTEISLAKNNFWL